MVLSGCASGPQYTSDVVSNNNSITQLIVYRPSSLIGAAESPQMVINGKPTCDLPGGSFFVSSVKPGKISIVSTQYGGSVKSSLTVDVKKGQKQFIRVSPNAGVALGGGFGALGGAIAGASADDTGVYKIRPVSADQGQNEIIGTKQSMSCR